MFELISKLSIHLEENDIPFKCYPSADGGKIDLYYPCRPGYKVRVRQFEDGTTLSVYAGKEWVNEFSNVEEVYDFIMRKHTNTRKAVDFINEEIGRLQTFDAGVRTLSAHARNLNLMALEGKLFRAYGRDMETEQIMRVLLRKTKPNALLVGPAGCGKTAIVENFAHYIVDSRIAYLRNIEENNHAKLFGEEYDEVIKPLFCDTIVYDLDLSALCAGTKYRGEFEEKIRDILRELEKNPNVVLFIDEIHQINTLGGAEGASGMGQLLKPALARGTIHCIGATTDEEAKIIDEDKALSRRFNKIQIAPLGGETAVQACEKILADYSKHHGISVGDVSADWLFSLAHSQLKATAFPDNFINLVDETMAGAKFERKTSVNAEDFETTVKRLVGVNSVSVRLEIGFNK